MNLNSLNTLGYLLRHYTMGSNHRSLERRCNCWVGNILQDNQGTKRLLPAAAFNPQTQNKTPWPPDMLPAGSGILLQSVLAHVQQYRFGVENQCFLLQRHPFTQKPTAQQHEYSFH